MPERAAASSFTSRWKSFSPAILRKNSTQAYTAFANSSIKLVSDVSDDEPWPDPYEMGAAALRGIALPQIAELRPHLVPEIAIWGRDKVSLITGRADALAIIGDRVDAAIDGKSDVHPTPAVREAHVQQLRDYLSATGAACGAIVYLTSGEIAWIGPP
ncbi:MAG: hypothetical protein EOQ40_30315 [Mesorhizobium sp.]|uniref:hypothetical protein n=1 Tax=Mesorhizobium sp. TaxID=1871066 RepID=UPI000FE89F9B|nr:hypothetical protein [Mesorhizobium sp.]RWB14332.1 MAG: hypothetical protein EOQ40_30315 [Mesorhizobium sp.]